MSKMPIPGSPGRRPEQGPAAPSNPVAQPANPTENPRRPAPSISETPPASHARRTIPKDDMSAAPTEQPTTGSKPLETASKAVSIGVGFVEQAANAVKLDPKPETPSADDTARANDQARVASQHRIAEEEKYFALQQRGMSETSASPHIRTDHPRLHDPDAS